MKIGRLPGFSAQNNPFQPISRTQTLMGLWLLHWHSHLQEAKKSEPCSIVLGQLSPLPTRGYRRRPSAKRNPVDAFGSPSNASSHDGPGHNRLLSLGKRIMPLLQFFIIWGRTARGQRCSLSAVDHGGKYQSKTDRSDCSRCSGCAWDRFDRQARTGSQRSSRRRYAGGSQFDDNKQRTRRAYLSCDRPR